jgi:hypothetical protein
MPSDPMLSDILDVCRETNRLLERRPTESQVRVIVSDEVRQVMSDHKDSCVPRRHFHETAQLAAETAGKVDAMKNRMKSDSQLLRWAKLIIPTLIAMAGSGVLADYFGLFK